MRWLFIISVVIPLTVAFICTTRQTMNRILIHDPQQLQLQLRCTPSQRAAVIRGRSSLFVDETIDTSTTAATTTTTTTTRETPLKEKKKRKPQTFSSTSTTKQPVVVNEQERFHSDEEEDDDNDDDDNASSTSTSTLRQKRGSKSSSSPLPVFRVVPARPQISAMNSTSIVFTVYGEPVPLSRHMVRMCMYYHIRKLSLCLFPLSAST